jgi:predicted transposase YdaD
LEDPAQFLGNPALLPFASLARSNDPERLLSQVAEQVAKIEPVSERQNIATCAGVLAGLRFEKRLLQQLFRSELMRESVFYQSILEEGLQEGIQRDIQQGLEQGKNQQ